MKIKKFISLLASLAMMVTAVTGAMTVSVISAADDYVTSGKIGENASWVVNTDDVLVISGQGDINGSGGWGWISLKEYIAEVVVEGGITSVTNTTTNWELISSNSCKYVSKITLPPSLTKLQGCLDKLSVFASLTDIYIYSKNITDAASVKGNGIYPEGITWHVYKDSATENSLRNDLGFNDEDIEYIPDNEKMPAITNKTPAQVEPLTNTSGPAGVTSKWKWNESSKTLTFSGAGYIRGYGDRTFIDYKKYAEKTEHIVIKSGITNIGLFGFVQTDAYGYNGAFCNFTALKDVELPDTLRIIGDGVFGKSNLTKIELPQTVEKIGRNAFSYTNLEEVLFSENVNSIGLYIGMFAFSNTKLKSIKLHEGMYIGGGAFQDCESLKEVTIPPNCTYGGTVGQGGSRSPSTFSYCTGLEKVIFENDVTELSVEGMFGGCTALKNVYFYTADLQSIEAVTSTAPTFEKNNNITFHVVKDSTTEQTLKDAGYLTDENTVYIADTTALETAIADAEAIETDKYTDESVSEFTKAIENAKAVLENLDATQEEVDSAVKAIEDAKNALADKSGEPSTDNSSDPSNSSGNNNHSQSPNTPGTPSTSAPTTAIPKPTTPPTVTTATKPAKVKNVKVTAKKKKLNVSWKKVSGVTGYEVLSATNNKFTKGKKKVTVKKNKVTLKKLKPKKKYFVKVRAYKLANGRKYFGKWSKVVKKKTK